MTNNEVLNSIHEDGYLASLPVEIRKTWEGKAFTYLADATLASKTAAYRGFVTGEKPIHLKSLEIFTEDADVTVEVYEGATYTGGSEVVPVARNRKTVITDYRDEFATMAFNTATSIKNQPLTGTPSIRRVINNGNLLYPEVAVSIDNTIDADVYGIKVLPVAQVDKAQGLQLSYKSKQLTTAYKHETISAAAYTEDVFKVLGSQSPDNSKPVVHYVYNNGTSALLTETTDYTITKDENDDWGITILSLGGADMSKDITVCYTVKEEYVADFTQTVPAFDFSFNTIAIGTPTDTFVIGEKITGGTSNATGIIEAIDLVGGHIYLSNVVGTFENAETLTGTESEATVDTTSTPADWFFVEFEKQSYDKSAITTATVANGTRTNIVEYLSFTQDYTFALDTTYKITLKNTAKTSAAKPVIVLYSVEELISKDSGMKVYTGPNVSSDGALIEKYLLPGSTGVGQSRISTGFNDDWELLLRPNTKYLIKAVSPNAQDISVKYKWYV
jgi:hypothetical protein